MDTEERDIFQFLKTWGADFTNARKSAGAPAARKDFTKIPTGPSRF